eukprot:CAMPEP_0179465156 /NCGR_PEP_ID=MMETSP0799-20121207/46795_1 /TAXON_ID=46947 /ORGANISM="Geminigera cryophila, Strain CCMP2564" /LENGTH=45 /DNA_ID= /DNA_START= /DNA_END= /DNA_ORIENTATION=
MHKPVVAPTADRTGICARRSERSNDTHVEPMTNPTMLPPPIKTCG